VSAVYKDFEWKTQISADEGTVDNYLFSGEVKPVAPQSFANVIGFLDSAANSKEKREILAEAKREYAKTHGIKVSQVRLKK
jgi:hypothetical protein